MKARLLPRNLSVLHIGCADGRLLARIRSAFPEAECYGVDWPSGEPGAGPASDVPGVRIFRLYIDRLFQSRPHSKRCKFHVAIMSGRFEVPGATASRLLARQADAWLDKRAKYVIDIAPPDRIRELRERGRSIYSLESGQGDRLICWASSYPLPEQRRAWPELVEAFLSFPKWFWQNLSRHGIADALWYAGHVAWAVLDGRLPWAALSDRDLRSRFCALLTKTRSVRADTVYVFVFLGEFGFEVLNWQGVVRRFARRLPSSSKIVVGGRKGLEPFYETAAQYIEIADVPEYRDSYAAAYFAMSPEEFRRHRPPTQTQFEYDRNLRRAVERHVRRELKVRARRVEFIFSSQFNGLEDCLFGVDPRFYGIRGHHGSIYATLDTANNEYAPIQAQTELKPSIEEKLGFSLDEPYILMQGRRRVIGPQSGGPLEAEPLVAELAKRFRIVHLSFESGRYLDSGSAAAFDAVTVYPAASFHEQSCLIAHAEHCVFLTEGDLGSHTYLPPLLGKNVTVVAKQDVFSQRSAPVAFWNRNVFRFGGQMIPWPSEKLAASDGLEELAESVAKRANGGGAEIETASPGKRILFIMRHEGYVRNCEYILQELAEKGHAVHVAIGQSSRKAHDAQVLAKLTERWPQITHGRLPTLSIRPWDDAAGLARSVIDYLRYFEPAYEYAPRLRARLARRAPRVAVRFFERFPAARHPWVLNTVKALFRGLDHVAPSHLESEEYLATMRPDLVVCTPLLDSGSSSLDHLKSARELGIPTALCVASWDNLSSKGLIQFVPDRVIVWNGVQKDEAVRMHHVPPERVSVTGAHLFDHWFEMQPSCSREEFCRRRGLNPAQPFLLYVCSSGFIAESEVPFVRRWIEAIRSAHSSLADIGILVRPHAANAIQWHDVDLSHYRNLTVWPPLGEGPVDPETKQHYFDSLYHCAAVIGINTSALIEGGIVGKPVFTILAEDFRETQIGTVHFHYLVQGGLLTTAEDLDEHVDQLGRVLTGENEEMKATRERFVHDFIRPHGLETPCSPLAVRALEDLLNEKPVAGRQGAHPGVAVKRLLSRPLAVLLHAYVKRARARFKPGGWGVGLINRRRDMAPTGRRKKDGRS